MLITLSIMAGLSIILLAVFFIVNHEYAGGIGARLVHGNTLSQSLQNVSTVYSSKFEADLCRQFKLRIPPSMEDKKQGRKLMILATGLLFFALAIQQSVGQTLAVLVAFAIGLFMPYANAHNKQQKFDTQLDKEVAEMFEIFNFYLISGVTLEEAIHQTADNSGELITPYLKRMVSNMMLQSKEEAIVRFGKELEYNQNITIFASALKQAIKGYEETLSNFVSMQSVLYTQLKNEQIEEVIMRMPTKFNMVTGLLIITMIFFLVVPVFTNVFSGMDVFFS